MIAEARGFQDGADAAEDKGYTSFRASAELAPLDDAVGLSDLDAGCLVGFNPVWNDEPSGVGLARYDARGARERKQYPVPHNISMLPLQASTASTFNQLASELYSRLSRPSTMCH